MAKQEKRREIRTYPARTLEEALRIVTAIKDFNGGNPWSPADIAEAVGISQRSTNFQYLTAAAREYGLVIGNFRSDSLSLTDLGRRIAYAENAGQEQQLKTQAFFSVDIFKRVFDHYKGSALPEARFLKNTLIDKFDLPEDLHEDFLTIFKENCRYLGLDISRADQTLSIPETEATGTRVVGRPQKDTGLKAFVIMPFIEHGERRSLGFFKEVLNHLIEPAATGAGFVVETANKPGSDIIQSTIINELLDADLVVADLTDHNPNVMFELGLRLADKKKPVAIIKSNDTGRLFDVDNMMRVYEYDPNLWPSTIDRDLENLKAHIKATWENRSTNPSYIDILRRAANA